MACNRFGACTALTLLMTAGLLACQTPSGEGDVGGTGGGEGGAGGSDGGNGGTQQEGGSAGEAAGGAPSMPGSGGGSVASGGKGGAVGGMGGVANAAGQGGAMVGTGGAMMMGGAAGSAPVAGACKTAAVCDDFEGHTVGQPPGAPWTRSGASKVSIAEDRPFKGKRSVKIEIPAGDGGEAMLSRKDPNLFPVKDQLYMRMMVYLDRAPSGSGLHWAFMQVQGAARDAGNKVVGLASYGVGGHPSQFQSIYLLPTNDNGLNDCWAHTNRNIPDKKWVCMEWHLDVPKDAQEVWADGQSIPELSFTGAPNGGGCLNPQTGGKWQIPDLSFARVGWINYHSINGVTVWIDDVVMDKKRVGCPAP